MPKRKVTSISFDCKVYEDAQKVIKWGRLSPTVNRLLKKYLKLKLKKKAKKLKLNHDQSRQMQLQRRAFQALKKNRKTRKPKN